MKERQNKGVEQNLEQDSERKVEEHEVLDGHVNLSDPGLSFPHFREGECEGQGNGTWENNYADLEKQLNCLAEERELFEAKVLVVRRRSDGSIARFVEDCAGQIGEDAKVESEETETICEKLVEFVISGAD